MTAPFVYDGAMNGNVFPAYVEQVLVPTLQAGEVVVIDSLPAHKTAGVPDAIERAGAELMFLPSYSPDFNPIEKSFSKLKAMLPGRAERKIDASGTRSVLSCLALHRQKAPTTSGHPVITRIEQDLL